MNLYSYIAVFALVLATLAAHCVSASMQYRQVNWGEQDSLKHNKSDSSRSLKLKPLIASQKMLALSGEVKMEGYYSEVRSLYQDIPNSYLRTSVNANLDLGGLPFQLDMLYSTESNNTHRINGIKIGFSNTVFIERLRKNMVDASNETRFAAELDSLNTEQLKLKNDVVDINTELATPEYQDKLAMSADLISNYTPGDTLNMGIGSGYRYAESKQFIAGHQLKMSRLSKAKARIKTIETRQQDIRIIKQNNLNNLDDENRVKKIAGAKLPFFHRVAMHVKTLEAGKITPSYNSLLLDGTSLYGINAEVNPGILYGSFTYGSLEYLIHASRPGEYIPPQQAQQNKTADVFWFRAGIRNGSHFSLILNQVVADIRQKQAEGTRNYRNTILGAELIYQHKAHLFKMEMAQSTYGASDNYLNNLKSIQSGSEFNYAVKGAYRVVLNKQHQLNLSLKTSYVAPDYFSVCVPFMRKDNLKTELGAGISVLKKAIRLETGLRNEQDNFHHKSPISNNISIYTMGIGFRYKKYPYVQVQLSPGMNRLRNLNDNSTYTQEFSVYMVSAGYTFASKKATYALTASGGYASYMQSFASDSFSYSKNYQTSTGLMISLKKAGIELGTNASLATFTEGTKQVVSDSRFLKLLGRYSAGTGYTYSRDPWSNTAALYYGSFSAALPFNILINIKAGHQFITRKDPGYNGPGDGLITNMNVCKKF